MWEFKKKTWNIFQPRDIFSLLAFSSLFLRFFNCEKKRVEKSWKIRKEKRKIEVERKQESFCESSWEKVLKKTLQTYLSHSTWKEKWLNTIFL